MNTRRNLGVFHDIMEFVIGACIVWALVSMVLFVLGSGWDATKWVIRLIGGEV